MRPAVLPFSLLALVTGLLSLTACRGQVDSARGEDESARNTRASRELNPSVDPLRSQRAASGILPVFQVDLNGRQLTPNGETDGELRVIEAHDGSLTDLATSAVALQSGMSLEFHGDTSSTLPKKSYRFELTDDSQEDRDLPLLGLPAGSDWVLHSCGFDPTCLRNVLVYSLGRELGHYAPRTRFIELFINDAYQGLYVLAERIRRDQERVDLPRPSETVAEGDITGGYIFKTDLGEGSQTDRVPRDWVSPVSQIVYSYYYPRHTQMTDAQKAYLRDHMGRFEAMMAGRNWNDADTGYRQWLDLPSWVDFALVQELSVNPDAYFKSVYLQKWPRALGDRIAIGPFWDFDLAFGVAEFRDARNTEAWAHTMNRFGTLPVPYDPPGETPFVPAYWERLWSDPAFQADLQCRWRELRAGPLQARAVNGMIDGWVGEVARAQPRDAALWDTPSRNPYASDVRSLKEFLAKRLAWMDANLPGRCAA